MAVIPWTLVSVAWFLILQPAHAEDSRAPDPLFQSDEVLNVRIVAPLSTLLSERPFEEELPAKFQYTDATGLDVEFDIKLRTRGKFRRQEHICKFPPLRLNFKTSQTKNTLFHKQDKIKLVTHCQRTARYMQVLLREYLAYRILNVMTNASYNVRLLQITYVDTEEKRRDDVRYGFVIEHKDRLAKRLDKALLEIPGTRVSALNSEYTNLISVYHYLIGNTDFSMIKAAPGRPCCHNHVLFGNEDELIYAIPYDFDQSGLVNAPHAGPSERFKLRNVRQRLYRGRCVNNKHLLATIAEFNSKREAITALINNFEIFSKRSGKRMLAYLEDFYKTIGSERKVISAFIKKCI